MGQQNVKSESNEELWECVRVEFGNRRKLFDDLLKQVPIALCREKNQILKYVMLFGLNCYQLMKFDKGMEVSKHHVKIVVNNFKKHTKGSTQFLSLELKEALLWKEVGSMISTQSTSEFQGNASYFHKLFVESGDALGLWKE